MFPDLGRRRRGVFGDDVRRQPPRSVRQQLAHDGGLTDAWVREEDGLDLGGLHAMATDLELVVGPPDEPQLSVAAEPHQIAGAVAARAAGQLGERGEPCVVLGPIASVAEGQRVTDEVQLAAEDNGQHAGQRDPDRHVAGGQGGVVQVRRRWRPRSPRSGRRC